jgi:hypothetical protein
MIQQVYETECLCVTSRGCRTHLWQSSLHKIRNIVFGVTQSTKSVLNLHDVHVASYCVCQNEPCKVRKCGVTCIINTDIFVHPYTRCLLTYSMEKSPSREANQFAASQEIIRGATKFKQRTWTSCRMPFRLQMWLAVCFVNQCANSCQAERTKFSAFLWGYVFTVILIFFCNWYDRA